MHCAPQLPEIVRTVVDYVASGDDAEPQTNALGDLAALAVVNRAFSEPAFDRVWVVAEVWELCQIIPNHLWIERRVLENGDR